MRAVIGLEGTAHTVGVGIVDLNGEILANVSRSYVPERGGIHPRKAADHHAKAFPEVIRLAMNEADVVSDDLIAVAFSQGPGLGPCLRICASAARTISLSLNIPLIGVNHCVAHLEVGRMTGAKDPIMLYVSGGNTQIIAFVSGRYRVFGETLDIGLGNMLDKLGLLLGFPFPAAPHVERLAKEGTRFIDLPYSVKGMDVAFSGILTAAEKLLRRERVEDICLSVQETVFAMLVEVTERAMSHTGKDEVLLGGGVAQNLRLQEMTSLMAEERGADCFIPSDDLLRDNGAMIAYTGLMMFRAGASIPVEKSAVRQRFRTEEVDVVWR